MAAGNYSAQTAVTTSTKQDVGGSDGDATMLAALEGANIADAAAVTAAGAAVGITLGTAAAVAAPADIQAVFDAAGYADIKVAGITNDDVATAANEAKASEKRLSDGDLVINGVAIAASSTLDDTASDTKAGSSDAAASGIAIAAAINKASEQTGVNATVNATEVTGGANGRSDGTTALNAGANGALAAGETIKLTVNGVDINLSETMDYSKNKAAAITAFNEVSGQTGVVASDNGQSLTLTAADGRNISLFAEFGSGAIAGGASGDTILDAGTTIENFGLSSTNVGKDTGTTSGDSAYTAAGAAKTTYSTVSLSSASAFEVSFGTSGSKGLDDSGLVAGTFGGGEDGQALTDIDIRTFEGAQKALVAVDNAIAQVASQRADLGAVQNRMESTVSNLQITSENLNSANSRIQDADFAAETAELQRTNVLQQAGISVLAQANASGQQVLSLLG